MSPASLPEPDEYRIENPDYVWRRIVYQCPHCGDELKSPLDEAGTRQACPTCGGEFRSPGSKEKRHYDAVEEDKRKARDDRRSAREAERLAAEERKRLALMPPPPPPPPPVRPLTPGDYPTVFVWWQRRHSGQTFPFACPDCLTHVQLRQRVTQTRRTCPGCGYRIDIAAIDRQLDRLEADRQQHLEAERQRAANQSRPERAAGCAVLIAATVAIAASIITVGHAVAARPHGRTSVGPMASPRVEVVSNPSAATPLVGPTPARRVR